ncbi:UNVERIFIED_ORG: putative ester cyclase [Rhizobium esperanzae]
MDASSSERAATMMYEGYIACLNARTWTGLGEFLADDVVHNGRPLGVDGYRAMLEQDCREIPDLYFHIDLVVANEAGLRPGFDSTAHRSMNFLGCLSMEGESSSMNTPFTL